MKFKWLIEHRIYILGFCIGIMLTQAFQNKVFGIPIVLTMIYIYLDYADRFCKVKEVNIE